MHVWCLSRHLCQGSALPPSRIDIGLCDGAVDRLTFCAAGTAGVEGRYCQDEVRRYYRDDLVGISRVEIWDGWELRRVGEV